MATMEERVTQKNFENHPFIPPQFRAQVYRQPTEYFITEEMKFLEEQLPSKNFSSEFLAALQIANADLLYYRRSVSEKDGLIFQRPTYLTEFTRETLTSFENFVTQEWTDAEKQHALFFSLEASEFLDVYLFWSDEKARHLQFWSSVLQKFDADGKYEIRLGKLTKNFA